jgi:uncharacterized protein YecE (DUF72 family)
MVSVRRPQFSRAADSSASGSLFPTEEDGIPAGSGVVEEDGNKLLRLGSSSFTAAGWEKSFYPRGMHSRDYLSYYATRFDTLEIDATYYGIPKAATVARWYEKTPPHFLFALKAPQQITHEKLLVGVEETTREFLKAVEPLREKLGVILLQFPYFSKGTFAGPDEFLRRLKAFLEKLPKEIRFAVEIRNKQWLGSQLYELLRTHHVALALIDHPWMPRPEEWLAKGDAITTDFTYIRWLGDRKEIEELTQSWDRTVLDRSQELEEWADACRNLLNLKIKVYAFANNHFGGHSPETLRLFVEKLAGRAGNAEA